MKNEKETKRKFVARPLFGPVIKEEPKEEVKEIKNESNIVAKSNIDGWISQCIPTAGTDRFVLINPAGERFACKFYNKLTNNFTGASLLAMYNLNDHFDRNIIPKEDV